MPRPPVAAPEGPARPPLRKPVSKVTWAVMALLLLAVWFLARPKDPASALAGRIDDAVALTKSCRLDEARAELADLRKGPATAVQLRRVQQAITSTAAACEKKELRVKAWNDARGAIESALGAGTPDRAAARLATFVKRWGEDDATREWRDRIGERRADKLLDEANACLQKKDRACAEARLDAADKLKQPESRLRIEALRETLSRLLESTLLEQEGKPPAPPVSIPSTTPVRTPPPLLTTGAADVDEARRLKVEAERELAQGNYRAATGRASQCAAQLPDECQPLRERAILLDREFQACLKAGRAWADGRCH